MIKWDTLAKTVVVWGWTLYWPYCSPPITSYSKTFATHCGLYRYVCLNFGIKFIPLQKIFSPLFSYVLGVCNIIIFGKSQEKYDRTLCNTLEKLHMNGLTINASICEFNVGPNIYWVLIMNKVLFWCFYIFMYFSSRTVSTEATVNVLHFLVRFITLLGYWDWTSNTLLHILILCLSLLVTMNLKNYLCEIIKIIMLGAYLALNSIWGRL